MTPTGAFLALLPAVFVPSLLLWGGESLWPAVLAYHAYCAGLPLALRFSAREAGFTLAGARRWLPWTLAFCVLLLVSAEALARLVDVKRLLPDGWEPLLAHARPWWAFVAYSLLVNAPSEEYFWRGFLLARTGIVGGSVLFWLMHAAAGSVFVGLLAALVFTLPTLFAGLAWNWMRRRSGSLWPSVFTHIAADAAILWVATRLAST